MAIEISAPMARLQAWHTLAMGWEPVFRKGSDLLHEFLVKRDCGEDETDRGDDLTDALLGDAL